MEGISGVHSTSIFSVLFQTCETRGEHHLRHLELKRTVLTFLYFLIPVHVLTLQGVLLSLFLPTLANTQVCNKVIWLILSFCFNFHFSVNGKMSMTVYILERQVPTFKMLRNSGSLSMMEALRLFSLYFSSTQHIQVRTYNVKFLEYLGRMKIGEAEDRILAWSMEVCFVSFFL